MVLLLISFVAGILTILAPCVLPVLPVIIGGAVGSGHKDRSRPYVITGALAASIIIFTLLLKLSTALVGLSPNILSAISGSIIIGLGVASVAPELWEKLVISLNWQAMSQRLLGQGERSKDKYIGPIMVGAALGPVFASCSPTYAFILASVLPHSFIVGLIYLIAYSLGLVVTLLGTALAGRKYIRHYAWAIDTHSWFRRGLGILFVLIGLIIISGNQIKLETWVAERLPFDEAKVEQLLLSGDHTPIAQRLAKDSAAPPDNSVLNTVSTPAPELQGLTNWINSSPLQLSRLRGKVVLVDFWTYSCINCIRTLPYIEQWYKTYATNGFIVIGVNTPEFAFEHNPTNVQAAVKQDGITYPVALDNNYDTWNAYSNNSWPADYLIDRDGNIRYVALGEGDYATTEQAIQVLLGTRGKLTTPTSNVPITQEQTPETYLGGNRQSGFSGTVAKHTNSDGSYTYTATPLGQLAQNSWTLSGNWTLTPQLITSGDSATLSFNVAAKDVYVVAGSANNQPTSLTISLDDTVSGQFGGDDPGGTVQISSSRLYHIASFKQFANTVVTLHVPKGISLYTFTFGS